jgi:hypothetical protein
MSCSVRASIGRLESAAVRTSAGVLTPTKGTGAAYTSDGCGLRGGHHVIPLITGTGTILAGDTVTFAGDTNKYVVATGIAAPGSIVHQLARAASGHPGLATALTVGNTATQNVLAFSADYMQLATRTPAMPEGGDMADDILDITDPVIGPQLPGGRVPPVSPGAVRDRSGVGCEGGQGRRHLKSSSAKFGEHSAACA